MSRILQSYVSSYSILYISTDTTRPPHSHVQISILSVTPMNMHILLPCNLLYAYFEPSIPRIKSSPPHRPSHSHVHVHPSLPQFYIYIFFILTKFSSASPTTATDTDPPSHPYSYIHTPFTTIFLWMSFCKSTQIYTMIETSWVSMDLLPCA